MPPVQCSKQLALRVGAPLPGGTGSALPAASCLSGGRGARRRVVDGGRTEAALVASSTKHEARRPRLMMPSQVASTARSGEPDRDEAQVSPAAGTRYGGRWGWALPARPVARSCAEGLAKHGTHWAVITGQSQWPMRHFRGFVMLAAEGMELGPVGLRMLMPLAPLLPRHRRGWSQAVGRARDVQSVGD